MLPNLSALHADGELEFRELSLDTGMKRGLSAARGSWNAQRLKIGSLTSMYQQLLEDIATRVRERARSFAQTPELADTELELEAMEELEKLFRRPLGAVFVPQYESQHASISPVGIPPSLAERIAVAFFQARRGAMPKTLNEWDARTFNRLDRIMREEEARRPGSSVDTQAQMARLRDNSDEVCATFVAQNKELANELARNAIRAFLALPSSKTQPLRSVNVLISLQAIGHGASYFALNNTLHMDNELDLFRDGARYGRPASEQDTQSIIASFCADAINPNRAALAGCGTVFYDGIPIVAPALLLQLAKRIQQKPTMTMHTEYEVLAALGRMLQDASVAAFGERSEAQLASMGITSRATNALEWSNVNAVTFHRSPSPEQVLENPTLVDGRAAPRMRAFAVMLADDEPRSCSESNCWRLAGITDKSGRPMDVIVDVEVRDGSGKTGMGEELMP